MSGKAAQVTEEVLFHYCEGDLAYISVDKHGKVFIADSDIEKIANLVIKKLKEVS